MFKNKILLPHSSALMLQIFVLLMLLEGALVDSSFLSMFSHVHEEKRTLDQIYAAALKEGGRLIVYAGGDTADQQDGTKAAFEQQFPNMTLDIVVDYSKFHGPRIEYQLQNPPLVPDVVQLQTLQDFPRFKKMGVLMAYKPAGWSAIYSDYRDADGYYLGIMVICFSNLVNTELMTNQSDWPREAADYLKPIFAGKKLAVTWPNDDDAVLFWFKQVVDKYGWKWVEAFVKQQLILVRGTQDSAIMVYNKTAVASMSSSGSLNPSSGQKARLVLPAKDGFTMWAQQAAIFKNAKHPEAAKLYLNWHLTKEKQQANMWPVRTDVPAPKGYPQSWDYKNQSSHKAFAAFMEDREAAERFRHEIAFFFGEPKGDPSPGFPGLYPDKALPH
uniref:Putative effector protein n=1 Tax=Heterodera avenae TaxID=34510 RepID=A0A2L0VDL0_HETAV|nr:putative effector protein [Heterodera avenae]